MTTHNKQTALGLGIGFMAAGFLAEVYSGTFASPTIRYAFMLSGALLIPIGLVFLVLGMGATKGAK